MKVVHVVWRDAHHIAPGGWIPVDGVRPGVTISPVGLLLRKTRRWLVVADPALGVAYMMFWRQDHHSKPPAERICFVPTPGSPEAANFGEFVAGPRPLLLAGIRHLYDTQVLEASSFAGGGK